MALKGAALDTRLQNKLLLDPKLQRRLSGDQFRAFINLMIFAVSQVSDGVFHRDDAEMVADSADVDALAKAGLVECDDEGLCRIHADYWEWQTSKAELERLAAKRENDRVRKQGERKKPEHVPTETPYEFEATAPWENA